MNVCNNTCALQNPKVNEQANPWKAVEWKKVIYRVVRIQKRIAKAVAAEKWGKVNALVRLITHSFDAKLLAVFRVTNNKGKYTAGVDKQIWTTDFHKWNAAVNLKTKGYNPKPLRRVYILKKNGKKRPLSIPCMHDRAMQALFKIALEPIAEVTADPNSYGFRIKRSCADAIEQCFLVLAKEYHAKWIFEADIKACFDEISHDWILKNIPINKTILKKWLKAGYIENKKKYKTRKGTPQGGIISPIIMNMVLDGMETMLRKEFPTWKRSKVNFVRYADDFVITSPNKETIESLIIPMVKNFLDIRGLKLSEEKSKISHIDNGFEFLSQKLRKYNKRKLIVKPAKNAVQSFKDKIKKALKKHRGIPAYAIIRILNPIIRGWSNYHKKVCSKKTFNYLGHFLWWQLWRWCKREYGNRPKKWIFEKHFRKNAFSDEMMTKKGKAIIKLYDIAKVPIKYHTKIRAVATPYLSEFDKYFIARDKRKQKEASECKQKTLVLMNKRTCNSRVSRNRGSLINA